MDLYPQSVPVQIRILVRLRLFAFVFSNRSRCVDIHENGSKSGMCLHDCARRGPDVGHPEVGKFRSEGEEVRGWLFVALDTIPSDSPQYRSFLAMLARLGDM